MGIVIGLVIFWSGVVFTALSIAKKIAVAPWIVVTIWGVSLIAYAAIYVVIYRIHEKKEKERKDEYDYTEDLY